MIHERIRQLEALDERIKLLNQERKELTTIPEGEAKKYGFSHEVGDATVQSDRYSRHYNKKIVITECLLMEQYSFGYHYFYKFKVLKKDGTPSLNSGYFNEKIKGL